jgi:hypothetical protein
VLLGELAALEEAQALRYDALVHFPELHAATDVTAPPK